MRTKIALDTNILIYLFDASDENKRLIAETLILEKPVISSQVVSEFLNVSKRLLKLPKLDIILKANRLFSNCEIASLNQEILEKPKDLIIRYDFQLYDSLIVAAALISGCKSLYSEDLQHNFLVENRLRIIYPFL